MIAASLAGATSAARADFLFFNDPGRFDKTLAALNLNPDENVLFNNGSLLSTGLLVQGDTNRTETVVNFESDETLTVKGGQARLEAVDGAFDLLDISLAGGCTFQSLQLNPNNVHKTGSLVTLSVVGANGETGSTTMEFTNGENRIGVIATGGQRIARARLSATADGSQQTIEDVKQVRIGGIDCPEPTTPPTSAIPEPGTVALVASAGLLPLLGLVRRRRSNNR